MAYDFRKVEEFVVEALVVGASTEKDVYDYVQGYIKTTLNDVRNTLSAMGFSK